MRRPKRTVARSGTRRGADRKRAPGTLRPGGRTERVRQAVATAALSLLRRGELSLSPAAVAAEAGIARSTVYRRWPTRADLLREAQAVHTRDLRIPDTGDFDRDVHLLARRLAKFFSDPTEVAINVAMATHTDPEFNGWQVNAWKESISLFSAVFERALERDDLPKDVSIPSLLEILISPMIVRTVVMRETLDARMASRLAGQVVRLARS